MYWGTAKWSPVEIFETFSMARTLHCIAPLCEYAEYHPFHREKVGTQIMLTGLTSSDFLFRLSSTWPSCTTRLAWA